MSEKNELDPFLATVMESFNSEPKTQELIVTLWNDFTEEENEDE